MSPTSHDKYLMDVAIMTVDTKNILVVDDDQYTQELLKNTLEAEGFNVILAGDGLTALEKFTRNQPDLVLLDIMMPGLNGYEVLKQIQEQSKVPVIMLTALNETGALVASFDLGAVDYIRKPFLPRELASRIKAKLRVPRKH